MRDTSRQRERQSAVQVGDRAPTLAAVCTGQDRCRCDAYILRGNSCISNPNMFENSRRHYADSPFSYVRELLTVSISSCRHFYGGSEIAAFTFRQNAEIWNRAQSCCYLQQSARTASVVKTGGYAAVVAVEYESKGAARECKTAVG